VLLVDFDSLHRSLTTGGGEAAARLVTKLKEWIGGLESGRLIGPEIRTFVVKRCYADPKGIGDGRASFTAAGFKIVDCASTNGGRGVDLLMAMDAIEQLADKDGVDEVVLMSGEPTLAPLLNRLKAHGRRTAIYADTHTGQAYRALADSVLDIAAFAEFLLTHGVPEGVLATALDRAEIEGFARKIHAATNIPLFSPRTFAELFRLLTEEIVANGYHFQTTAKNVADRLSESGRSVTRRQVVFIVKGLALKGHVFSTSDSPRKLAEVFREQARYLIESAGLKLDEQQERILSAWLVDRAPTSLARPVKAAAPAEAAGGNGAQPATTAAKEAPAPAGADANRAPDAADRGAASSPAATAAAERQAPGTLPARPEPRAPGSMITPEDARAAIAAKIAQSVRPKPVGRPGAKPTATAGGAGAPAADGPSAATASPPVLTAPVEGQPPSIETSILAAIAEAVDVLVEDGEAGPEKIAAAPAATGRKRTQPLSGPAAARPAEPRPARPEPQPRPARRQDSRPEGEDIGDEIQRIIATYNRNRKDDPST
jgi:hypothetical protein